MSWSEEDMELFDHRGDCVRLSVEWIKDRYPTVDPEEARRVAHSINWPRRISEEAIPAITDRALAAHWGRTR